MADEPQDIPSGSAGGKYTKGEKITANVFLSLYIAGIAILVIGVIWWIKDLFTEQAFEAFQNLKLPVQLIIVALIMIFMLFLLLFLVILYRRNKLGFVNALFKKKFSVKKEDESFFAKFIATGTLLSLFVIFIGFIVAIIEYLVKGDTGDDTSGIWEFIDSISGGIRIMLISGIIILATTLLFGLVFSWLNGFGFFENWVMKINKKSKLKLEFTKKQKLIGNIVFGLFVADILAVMLGTIWAIIDATVLDWAADFAGYGFGIKFSILGLLGTILFIIIVVATSLYRFGNYIILNAIFKELRKKDEGEKTSALARFISIFLLFAVTLIGASLVLWVINLATSLIAEDTEANLFVAMNALSIGLAILSYSITIFVFMVLTLLFIFLLHNGYFYVLAWISKTEQKLDPGMADTGK